MHEDCVEAAELQIFISCVMRLNHRPAAFHIDTRILRALNKSRSGIRLKDCCHRLF